MESICKKSTHFVHISRSAPYILTQRHSFEPYGLHPMAIIMELISVLQSSHMISC